MRRGAVGFDTRVQPMEAAEMRDDGRRFEGTAVVFDTWAMIGAPEWGFRERWAAGSLDKTVREADIVFLDGHEPLRPISRVSADTLRLGIGTNGLDVDSDMDTRVSYVNDLAINVENRNIKGMSFGFRVTKDEWVRGSDGIDERTVREAAVHEISATAFPAFVTTDAAVRSAVLSAKMRRGTLTDGEVRAIRTGATTGATDLRALSREVRRAIRAMTANDTFSALAEAVNDAYGTTGFAYVLDYDDTYVYYTVYDWDDNNEDTFRQTYTLAADGLAALTGAAEQVRARANYVPVSDGDDTTTDEPPTGTRSTTSEPAHATRAVEARRLRIRALAAQNGFTPPAA